MQASSLRESDGGYFRERPFETLTRSNGPPRSIEKGGAALRRKPQQPRFMLLVAISADVAAETGRITATRRMPGSGYSGRLLDRFSETPSTKDVRCSPQMCVVNIAETISFGYGSEQATSTFIFMVEMTTLVGRFWHSAEAAREIAGQN